MNDNDPSVIRNRHEDLAPVQPQVLEGEVKAGASHPDQEESVSVLANRPEVLPAPQEPEPLGEIAAGASVPGEQPPSVVGTSFEEK
jgi:hypothetical protein